MELKAIEKKLGEISRKMNGDRVAGQLDIDQSPSVNTRLFGAYYDGYGTTSDPTSTMKEQLSIAGEEFTAVLAQLKAVFEQDIKAIEQKLEAVGAPYTPGRMPDWKKN